MTRVFQPLVRSLAVFLFCFTSPLAGAGECLCREPRLPHGRCPSCGSLREADHGLIHYPNASYWASGTPLSEWAGGAHCHSFTPAAPSPWAYHSIAPYAAHYHFFYGDSDWLDCRN